MEDFIPAGKPHITLLSIAVIALFFLNSFPALSQKASITEETQMLKTYPFDDPNPIPILKDNTKIYPYHKFEGYGHEGQNMPWKVITLENDYIQVFVMPEAGGKVWGAIDKSTGKEFIYRNEVMKHRNISMRGPWTSGGIEFNFGIIGHHPSTAAKVDYAVQENDDGSVSCIVGTIDLPSRTHWRVNITLPKDKAYFETKALWYNPTPIHQSYYNWMTAAAFAKDDLEFYTPGNQYLKHSGEAMPWPYDSKERKISAYKNNNFGPSKSYHVVGEYNDFFGGYYHNEQFGFGHWSLYEEIPGQKLWLWALSRTGGIWEDLLTDTDGQYIEFQAGRLFDQYSPGDHINPITQATFAPYSADTWRELWFPFNQIGGMSDVSPMGVLHVKEDGRTLEIGINALAQANAELVVKQNGTLVHQETLQFQPAQTFTRQVTLKEAQNWEVSVAEMDLKFSSNQEDKLLKRPFGYPEIEKISPTEQLFVDGMELMEYREFGKAKDIFEQCLEQDGSNQRALIALAELHYRSGAYDQAMSYAHKALAIDTYNPPANYVAGIIYRAQGDLVNALESLGWAARSMEFRSAAYAQMAEISLQREELDLAKMYANKSLDFNRYNINAYHVLTIAGRLLENEDMAKKAMSALLRIDPIHHFVHYEKSMWDKNMEMQEFVRGEFPEQTYLELAIDYYNRGQQNEAIDIFENVQQHPIARLWLAYLHQSDNSTSNAHLSSALERPVDFVFPFRRETIPVLEWAAEQTDSWIIKYYLGLNYWGKDRTPKASDLFEACGQEPNYAPFYMARADLLKKTRDKDGLSDLQRALALSPTGWRAYSTLIRYYDENGHPEEALKLSAKAYKRFPSNYNLGMSHAKALLNNGEYKKCIESLKNIEVLPFEGASEGRVIYEQSHLLYALEMIEKRKYEEAMTILKNAMEWPENLGVGKPYDPDNRAEEYLLAYCYDQLSKPSEKEAHLKNTMDYTKEFFNPGNPKNLLGLLSLRETGNKKEADDLIIKIKNSDAGAVTDWILAQYSNETGAIVKQSEAHSNLEYLILNKIVALVN